MMPPTTFAQRVERILLLIAMLVITYPIGVYFNAQKLMIKVKAIKLPAFNFSRFKMPGLSIQKLRSTTN